MLERICGLQLFQMDVSHQKPELSYRALSRMIQWTKPVHNSKDCSCVLDSVLNIGAQGGAFALCRLLMSIKQHAI